MSNHQTFQVPEQNFKLEAGTPKVYTKVSDFGRVSKDTHIARADSRWQGLLTRSLQEINTHFCATCGTSLYRTGGAPNVKGMVGIRAGVLLDDPLLDEAPKIEVYVEKRPKWKASIEGAIQLNGKYEMVEAEQPNWLGVERAAGSGGDK